MIKIKQIKLLISICVGFVTLGLTLPVVFSSPIAAQAQTPVEMAPGQTRVFEIEYENKGDENIAVRANLRILIGSELIVDTNSFTDQWNGGPVFPVSSSTILAANPGLWGYQINYVPRSATTIGTPSGINGLTPGGDADLTIGQKGVFRFSAKLKEDIFNGQRPNPTSPYTPGTIIGFINNQGINSRLNSINADGSPTPSPEANLSINLTDNTIIASEIANCPTQSVSLGTTYNCDFALSGNASQGNSYSLPQSGIVAGTGSTAGRSNACTIVDNGTATALLRCVGIPTSGNSAGTQVVNLYINGSATATPKGSVTLTENFLTATNIGNCPGTPSVNIGSTYNCIFPIVNNPSSLPYSLPAGGINVGTGNLASRSDACTLSGTPIATELVCNNIPTTGSTAGTSNINVYIGGSSIANDRGDVLLAFPPCTNGATNPPICDICPVGQTLLGGVAPNGNCQPLPSTPIVYLPLTSVTFTPNKNTPSKFGQSALSLTVRDARITDGASCQITYREFKDGNSVTNYSAVNLTTNAVYDNTSGCNATLPPNFQNKARYEFRIRITDANTGITSYPSLTYGIDTAYSMNFGAIGVVSINAV